MSATNRIAATRRVPQIILLLDGDTRVLNANRSLAGAEFESLSGGAGMPLHAQFHPGCAGRCRFDTLLQKAMKRLDSRDSIEWEIADARSGRLLRMHLSRMPAPQAVEAERRRRHLLLTMTDITRNRREIETVLERHEALVRQLSDGEAAPHRESAAGRGNPADMPIEASLGRQLIDAQERERRRIAAELHDGIAQSIGVVKYRLEAATAQVAANHGAVALGEFNALVDELRGIIDEVRRVSRNLLPGILDDFGLLTAIEFLAAEFMEAHRGTAVVVNAEFDEDDVPDDLSITMYRIVQEALQNAGKHAGAREVAVTLKSEPSGFHLQIADDGVGFDAAAGKPDGGLGLKTMRDRVSATRGEIDLWAAAGRGVRITATWSRAAIEESTGR